MHILIETHTGHEKEENLTMTHIQDVIDELQSALSEAFQIRERLKIRDYDQSKGQK